VDRNLLLHSGFYRLTFGSWRKFQQIAAVEEPTLNMA
jgi:hypothetical protein